MGQNQDGLLGEERPDGIGSWKIVRIGDENTRVEKRIVGRSELDVVGVIFDVMRVGRDAAFFEHSRETESVFAEIASSPTEPRLRSASM